MTGKLTKHDFMARQVSCYYDTDRFITYSKVGSSMRLTVNPLVPRSAVIRGASIAFRNPLVFQGTALRHTCEVA
jgi:hypothetical protein